MRIAYITAGAGGMVCGSCIHDNALARELQALGHDAALIPIYTPLRTDDENVSLPRVFYGAITVYLEQKVPLFGRLPRFLRSWLDAPGLLRHVPTSGSTDARGLGELALSMLQGEEGRQRSELAQLSSWLRDEFRPEVVQLTNSMLLGFARRLRRDLPEALLVCSLQGEDLFLDDLVEPHRSRVMQVLRERAKDVDMFVATGEYYRAHMAELLEVSRERIQIARLGVDAEVYTPATERAPEPPWLVGYVGRICPEKGLHLLVEAFRLLVERLGKGKIRLRVAGYLGVRDRRYFEEIVARLERWGLREDVDLLGEVDRDQKIELLRSLHLFSLPTVYREAKGLSVLEAMAAGVPVVEPGHGTFPEMLERTGGGVLVEPGSAEALADGLERLLLDRDRRLELGRLARAGVQRHYTAAAMARDTLQAYRRAARLERTA